MAMVPIGHFPREVCRDFAAAGVHLYSHIIWNNRATVPRSVLAGSRTDISWWHGPGQYDFSKIDAQFEAIIEADPQAYIFPRVKLNPPKWWLDTHPDERTQYEGGTRGSQYSMASEAWEATYERMLRDLIRHIEGSPYAGHIIGYQPAGGESSEWFWWGFRKGWIDYSPAARKRFRAWLGKRYHGDVSQLRKAWNDSSVTFETAEPPSGKLRETTEYLLFRDARTARPAIDFQRFLSNVTAENIVRSCRICKEETRGKKIAGVFYGYSIYSASTRLTLWNCGWLGLRQVLESPYVDFLCAPTDYSRRRGGDPGTFISAYSASYRLHQKLYWDEADFRTHLFQGKVSYATRSLNETLETLRRAFGYMLTKGTALWWFTLAGDDTFHQDEIMNDIARMKDRGDASMPCDKEPLREVAVLVDEESFYHMRAGASQLTRPLIVNMHQLALPTMGAPFDTYLLSDIANEKMPDYKLYLFLNSFAVSDTVREAIKKKVRRNGAGVGLVLCPRLHSGGRYVQRRGHAGVDRHPSAAQGRRARTAFGYDGRRPPDHAGGRSNRGPAARPGSSVRFSGPTIPRRWCSASSNTTQPPAWSSAISARGGRSIAPRRKFPTVCCVGCCVTRVSTFTAPRTTRFRPTRAT